MGWAAVARLGGRQRWPHEFRRRHIGRSWGTSNATIAWPADRERVDVGTLTINQIESEETSPVRAINFDPLVLPNGITGSDDPLLSARSAAYSQSFTRRIGEPKSPSAVTSSEVGK